MATARIADLALRRPRALLAGAALALVASLAVGIGAPDELGIGSSRLVAPPDDERPRLAELAVVLGGEEVGPDSRVFRVAEDVVRAQIAADPAVRGTRRASVDGGVALIVEFGDASGAERQAAAIRLDERIDPGPLEARLEGELARLLEARRALADELWRHELLVLPLALLALAGAGGPLRVVAPALSAALAVCGSLALLRVAGVFADVSLLGFGTAAAVGLVLGVESALLLLRRYDEEAALAGLERAVRRMVEEGGRALGWLALAASLPPLALLATPLDQAASLALGCALGAGLGALSGLAVAPAVTVLAARRSRAPRSADRGAAGLSARAAAIVGRLASSPLAAGALAAGAVALLAAATWPVLDVTTVPFAAPRPAPGDSIPAELPVAAAIAIALGALVTLGATRAVAAAAAAALPALLAGAAVGVTALVFRNAELAELLGAQGRDALDTAAVAIALAALVAIVSARGVAALLCVRDERRLGAGGAESAEQAARLTLLPAAAASAVGALAAAAMVAVDLQPARELGLALSAGLALDLLVLRVPLLVASGRGGPRPAAAAGENVRGRGPAGSDATV